MASAASLRAITPRTGSDEGCWAEGDAGGRVPRAKVIPQIFAYGADIGGYEDLCLLDERGRLVELVAKAD